MLKAGTCVTWHRKWPICKLVSIVEDENLKGFAFGMGIERLSMLKYGMPDLRDFFESDLRWLNNYGFSFLETTDLSWR